jgi:type II secretory pathway pseudopilin PulG
VYRIDTVATAFFSASAKGSPSDAGIYAARIAAPRKLRSQMKKAQGFLLLEILVSMASGTLFSFALIKLFLSQKRLYDSTETMIHIQNNAYWAMALLKQAIHHAGYVGCVPLTPALDLQNTTEIDLNADNYFTVNDSRVTDRKKKHTDHLTVRYLSPKTAILTHNMERYYQLRTDRTVQFKVGEVIMLADCDHADIATIENVSEQENEQWIALSRNARLYQKGTQVGKIQIESYYIGHSQRRNRLGEPINSLFIATPSRHEELIEGVDDLQLTVMNDKKGETVRIQLLFNSINPTGLHNRTYQQRVDVVF